MPALRDFLEFGVQSLGPQFIDQSPRDVHRHDAILRTVPETQFGANLLHGDIPGIGKQTQVRILMAENCQIADLSPLVTLCEADAKGERSLAPFLRLYLENNPLSQDAKDKQIPALTAAGVRVNLDRTAKKGS